MKSIVKKNNVTVIEDMDEEFIYNFCLPAKLSDGSFFVCARQITDLHDPYGRTAAVRYFPDEGRIEPATPPNTADAQCNPYKGFLMCYVTQLSENNLIAVYGMIDTDNSKPLFDPVSDGMQNMSVRISRSCDNGKTWSAGEDIAFKHEDIIVPGAIVKLPDGTIGFPVEMHNHYGKDYNESIKGRFIYSTDGGKTFDKVSEIPHAKGVLAGDGRCTIDGEGNLLIYYWFFDLEGDKDLDNHRSISRDFGRTFEPAQPIDMHMQIVSPMYFDDDTFVLVYQERFSDNPGIKAALSCDGGITFDTQNAVTIYGADSVPETGNPFKSFDDFKFGYSTITKTGEHTALIMYWSEQQHGISTCACEIEIV